MSDRELESFALKPSTFMPISLALLLLLGGCNMSPVPTPTPPWAKPGWSLVWHDEFDGDGIERANWQFDIGGHGFGNEEHEYYTDRAENARIEDGLLVIEARLEDYQGRPYTSARLKTQDLQAFTYGRIEARLKIPYGQGIWPAFWMLGDNIETVDWPGCGEIDIMENIGREPSIVHGTLHGPGYSGAAGPTGAYEMKEGRFADDFHVYAIEWEADQIRWYVDDVHYKTLTRADIQGQWVFDHPFFILLNVAVGGLWPGYPDDTTTFPQQMRVDYVRVYSASP